MHTFSPERLSNQFLDLISLSNCCFFSILLCLVIIICSYVQMQTTLSRAQAVYQAAQLVTIVN